MTLALVPVKRLADTKSRLLAQLKPEEREAFSLAMLRDVIEALLASGSVDMTVVATPDVDVADAARAAGADALVRDDPGLNQAIDAAATALAREGEAVLVVLGDVAGIVAEDVDSLCEALAEQGGRGAALAPSSDGGTSALLRAPRDVIPSRFGPDSAKRHREAAARAGVPYTEVPLPSLAVDLDVPEDVARFLETTAGGIHTRRCLHELGWGERT